MTVTPNPIITDNVIDINSFLNEGEEEFDRQEFWEWREKNAKLIKSWRIIKSHVWLDSFHPAIREMLKETQESFSYPAFGTATTLLCIVASLLGNMRVLCKESIYDLSCNLYALILMESGKGKSPSESYITSPLDEFEDKLLEKYKEKKGKWEFQQAIEKALLSSAVKEFKKQDSKEGDWKPPKQTIEDLKKSQLIEAGINEEDIIKEEPKEPAIIVTGGTREGFAKKKPHNGNWGVLIHNDEAVQYFEGLGAYSKNGAGADISATISRWDGSREKHVLASEDALRNIGELKISMSLAGQPDAVMSRLKKVIGEDDPQGFLARFLICYPLPLERKADDDWGDAPPKINDLLHKVYGYILNNHASIGLLRPKGYENALNYKKRHLRFSRAAYTFMKEEVRNKYVAEKTTEASNKIMLNLLNKVENIIARLSASLHVLNSLAHCFSNGLPPEVPYEISPSTVNAAFQLMKIYYDQTDGIVSMMDETAEDMREAKIIRAMAASGQPMSVRDIVRKTKVDTEDIRFLIEQWLEEGKVKAIFVESKGKNKYPLTRYVLNDTTGAVSTDV